jgi:hypothetical protein
MARDIERLMGDLERLEQEARRIRSELERGTVSERQRDEAVLRAASLIYSTQMAVGPGPSSMGPGAGSGSGSSGTSISTTCPHCKHALSITLA